MNRYARLLRFLPTALVFLACSSSSSTGGSSSGGGVDGGGTDQDGGGAGDGDTETKQQGILKISTTNSDGGGTCTDAPELAIGEFGDVEANKPARVVPNGTKENGTVVAVSCKVVSASGGFSVYGTVGRSGTTFEILADVDSKGASSAGKMTFIGPNGTWSSETCVLSQPLATMGVAAGRYWAAFSCPSSTSTENLTCDVSGEIRLENCTDE